MTHLNKLQPGQKGKVVGFTNDNRISRRLLELGVVPGRDIAHVRNAPLNDPMEIQVGPCCLSLRHAEASMVTVELDD